MGDRPFLSRLWTGLCIYFLIYLPHLTHFTERLQGTAKSCSVSLHKLYTAPKYSSTGRMVPSTPPSLVKFSSSICYKCSIASIPINCNGCSGTKFRFMAGTAPRPRLYRVRLRLSRGCLKTSYALYFFCQYPYTRRQDYKMFWWWTG